MNFAWYNILGTAGVATIVITYVLLQTERLRSGSLNYSLFNGIGALLILVSLYFEYNFPSFVVEFFWLLISLFGITRYFTKRRGGLNDEPAT